MKAILTRYHGPTNLRGARYSATDSDDNRVSLPSDFSVDAPENHRRAALALCHKLGWTGTLHSGSLGNDYVHVWGGVAWTTAAESEAAT